MLGGVCVLALAPFSFHATDKLETAVHIERGEAESVTRELETQFDSSCEPRGAGGGGHWRS